MDSNAFGTSYSDAPSMVNRAPRLPKDLDSLSVLTQDPEPPLRVVRSKFLKTIGVSFVDASGQGKGGSTMSEGRPVSIQFAKDLLILKKPVTFEN